MMIGDYDKEVRSPSRAAQALIKSELYLEDIDLFVLTLDEFNNTHILNEVVPREGVALYVERN